METFVLRLMNSLSFSSQRCQLTVRESPLGLKASLDFRYYYCHANPSLSFSARFAFARRSPREKFERFLPCSPTLAKKQRIRFGDIDGERWHAFKLD